MNKTAFTFVLDPDKACIQDLIAKVLIKKAGFDTVTRDVRPFQLRYRLWNLYVVSLDGVPDYHWDLLAADIAKLISGCVTREVLTLDSFTADAIESWGVPRPHEYGPGWFEKLCERLDKHLT